MSIGKIAGILVIPFVSSCSTSYVWEHTDPNAKDKMPDTAETMEYIEKNGLDYQKDSETGEVLVEKTTNKKVGNYFLRIIGIPTALVVDTVGLIAMGMAANSNSNSSHSYAPSTSYQPQTLTHSSSGMSANQIGNTTYYSDGTTANKIGNTTYYSNGGTSTQIGNTLYNSDGTTIQKIGNSTYGSDGRVIPPFLTALKSRVIGGLV